MATALVTRRAHWVTVTLFVLLVALAWPARGLRSDNDLHAWLPAAHAGRREYLEFQRAFGGDDSVVIATDETDSVTAASMARLEEQLRALPGVASVIVPVAREADGSVRWSVDDPFAAPLRAKGWAGALVLLEPRESAPRQDDVLTAIERLAARLGPHVAVAGPVVIHRALDAASRDALAALLPAAALGVLFILIIGLSSLRAALAVLAASGAASAATLGIVALAGRPMHMVLSVLPALLVVVGTGYALHPVVRYLDDPVRSGETDAQRLRRVLAATRRPALIAAVTTAGGLLALLLADLAPVQELGVFGAVGVLLAWAVAYTWLPSLLITLRVRPFGPRAVPRGRHGTWPERVLRSAVRRPMPVIVVAALLLAVALGGVAQLRVESNVMRLLPTASPVRVATEDIEEHLLGLTPLEIRVDGSRDVLFSATTRAAQKRLRGELLKHPLVTHVLSPYAYLEQGLDVATTGAVVPSHLQLGEGDAASVRLTVCSKTVASDASRRLAEDVLELTRRCLPDDVRISVTGVVPLLADMQSALVTAQTRSFAGAFVLVSAVLWFELGSFGLAGLALIPNLAPVACAAGFLGWSNAPLDAATVAVAGVAFGLAVDDTVHVLHRWRFGSGERNAVLLSDESGVAALDASSTRAIWLTTAAAVGGFACFAGSGFPPARRFGLLVAGAAVVAVLADLVLLPALLSLRARATSDACALPGDQPS